MGCSNNWCIFLIIILLLCDTGCGCNNGVASASDCGGIEAVAVDGYAARPSEKRGERTVKILALGHIIDNALCR